VRRALTTKPDHNRIRQSPIPADALVATAPGERPHPTTWAYFASRGSGVRVPLAPPGSLSPDPIRAISAPSARRSSRSRSRRSTQTTCEYDLSHMCRFGGFPLAIPAGGAAWWTATPSVCDGHPLGGDSVALNRAASARHWPQGQVLASIRVAAERNLCALPKAIRVPRICPAP
jgi:hypothetical protein